jgi:hypothetical protein
MLAREKMSELVTNLIRRTKEGAITWGETAEEDTFRVVLSTGIVRVGRFEKPHGFPFALPPQLSFDKALLYSLVLLDNQSRELSQFISTNLDDVGLLGPLWDLAFSSARNPEKKIDSILRELAAKPGK